MAVVLRNLDPDIRTVVEQLCEALATSGLTQAGFARALGTSASRLSTYLHGTTCPSAQFVARAQRLARALAAAATRGLMTAPATAAAVREQRHGDDLAWVWRMLLQGRDHLRLMLAEGDEQVLASWEAAPTSTGSPNLDALLAALTRHEYESAQRVAPGWTKLGPLDGPWTPEHPFLTSERAVAQTPPWLRELNIFIPARDLITA